jgi:hypothetical protein
VGYAQMRFRKSLEFRRISNPLNSLEPKDEYNVSSYTQPRH